jgi:hypothetical protein
VFDVARCKRVAVFGVAGVARVAVLMVLLGDLEKWWLGTVDRRRGLGLSSWRGLEDFGKTFGKFRRSFATEGD